MANNDKSVQPKTARERAIATAARAKALRQHAKQNPGLVGRQFGGFMDFVRTQGVVGLAVGLAIGTQASELVKSIVSSLITPIVDLIVGEGGLANLTWTAHVGTRSSIFSIGVLIDAIIRFMAIAFVIYFVVKGFKLDRIDKEKAE